MSTSRSAPLFAADSIGKSFGRHRVLKSASVWAWRGAFTLLMGRNGSGKTTLLRAGVGLVSVDHGVVKFRGESYLRPRLSHLARRGLFYWPDRGLLPRRGRVRQHLAVVGWHSGSEDRVESVSGELALGDLLDTETEELSGGERRRVEAALVKLRAPVCLLADEPFAGISPKDADVISAVLRDLARSDTAIVITGHELPPLMELADEVVWVVAGTTHGLGSSERAMEHEQFRREYLGSSPPQKA